MVSGYVEEVMCVPWLCDGEYDILNNDILCCLVTGAGDLFVDREIIFALRNNWE